jgi:hypothetical protein
MSNMEDNDNEFEIPKLAAYVLLSLAIGFLLYQLSPFISSVTGLVIAPTSSSSNNNGIDFNKIIEQVTPKKGITINAVWGNVVQDMIKKGVLDVNKLRATLQQRYGIQLGPEEEKILTTPNLNEKITINSDNAVFLMYIFGILAKHNNNPIIHNSPFKIPRIFSDAGRDGWGDVDLITLTPEQQAIVEYTSSNSYRPCCGQPTSRPDCTHGFSLLGLQELMASQGFSKEEIFKASVVFNSYWFPANYIYDAIYFKVAENKDWHQVDPAVIMSRDYSSISGAMKVQSYLKSLGII